MINHSASINSSDDSHRASWDRRVAKNLAGARPRQEKIEAPKAAPNRLPGAIIAPALERSRDAFREDESFHKAELTRDQPDHSLDKLIEVGAIATRKPLEPQMRNAQMQFITVLQIDAYLKRQAGL